MIAKLCLHTAMSLNLRHKGKQKRLKGNSFDVKSFLSALYFALLVYKRGYLSYTLYYLVAISTALATMRFCSFIMR